ncbi:MAG: P-II family nitrogen regulator, partial [Pseudomonadota bacterium]
MPPAAVYAREQSGARRWLGHRTEQTRSPTMKLVTAIIKPFKLDDVRESLSEIG